MQKHLCRHAQPEIMLTALLSLRPIYKLFSFGQNYSLDAWWAAALAAVRDAVYLSSSLRAAQTKAS
jgi:hypothetical protein